MSNSKKALLEIMTVWAVVFSIIGVFYVTFKLGGFDAAGILLGFVFFVLGNFGMYCSIMLRLKFKETLKKQDEKRKFARGPRS